MCPQRTSILCLKIFNVFFAHVFLFPFSLFSLLTRLLPPPPRRRDYGLLHSLRRASQVSSSQETSKRAFLEKKGLTPDEIAEAFKRVPQPAAPAPSAAPPAPAAPVPAAASAPVAGALVAAAVRADDAQARP